MKSTALKKSFNPDHARVRLHKIYSPAIAFRPRAVHASGYDLQFTRLLGRLGHQYRRLESLMNEIPGLNRTAAGSNGRTAHERLDQRLRRDAETAARRGDLGASDFLADLQHEQELISFEWNCPHYITPGLAEEGEPVAVAPLRQRIAS